MITCNVIVPQLFWFKKVRQNLLVVFIMSILVNIGMWFERFVIIVIAAPRFPAVELGLLPADVGGHSARIIGHVRIVLHVVPVVPAVSADDCDFGSERRDAASRSASSAGRRESKRRPVTE